MGASDVPDRQVRIHGDARCHRQRKSTLEAFYAANKALQFDFVFRDELTTTYTGCVFIKSPQYKLLSRGVWRATVQIRQQ